MLRRRQVPCLTVAEAVRLLDAGQVPRRAAVITFDDGYADNCTSGLPLLEEFDVSATVFLATGALGKDREFWWDELEKALLRPGRLPEVLTIEVGLHTHDVPPWGSGNFERGVMRCAAVRGAAGRARRHRGTLFTLISGSGCCP